MFHFSDDKITEILSAKTPGFTYFTHVASDAHKEYKPLFFTPYRSFKEFGQELIAPLENPLSLCGMAAGSLLMGGIAAVLSAAALLVSAAAALLQQTKARDVAFEFACNVGIATAAGLITAASALLLAVLSIPYTLLSLLTRAVSTLLPKASVKEPEAIELTTFSTSYAP